MFPSTDPPSSEDAPAPQADEPRCAEQGGRNSNAFAATNPHLDRWLEAVGGDTAVSPKALSVAVAMARFVGIGRIAYTNWQSLNTTLARDRRDREVLASMGELQSAGYLTRHPATNHDRVPGWALRLPEEEL
ncbi:hypothetical protein [Arthrobacter sp. ok362]|uniref:hypothetical protein n=1 Tax=Arthrobacter sp. ok362 TaxID=1761745 RepID=UPI00087E7E95|nr:hypothetical protein [Arthrobacter sp. ok362]SDL39986.1 hypothetical protein SAMN04487913_10955 [Arthrobacter sp. ok362]